MTRNRANSKTRSSKAPVIEASESNTADNSYISGLNRTWAFSQKLDQYTLSFKILILIARLFTFIFYSLFYVLSALFFTILNLFKRNKKARIVILIILGLFLLWMIDFIINYDKVHPGVYVGDIDLGGKTVEESHKIVNENFSSRLTGNNVVIYVSEEAREQGEMDDGGSGVTEQLNVDEAKQTVRYWKTNSVELDATLPVDDIVDEAMNSTRGLGNIFNRLDALLFKKIIPPYANYNNDAINNQIYKINDTIGSPVVNPTCVIEEGQAVAVEGSNGYLINDDEFMSQLNNAFFQKDSKDANFIPKFYNAYQNISYASAQKLSEKINNDLSRTVNLEFKGNRWNVDRLNLCNWININIENRTDQNNNIGCSCSAFNNSNYCIYASVDGNKAGNDILYHTKDQNVSNQDYSIKFIKNNNNVAVQTNGDFEIPSIHDAINKLNNDWLGDCVVYDKDKNKKTENSEGSVNINIGSTQIPESLSVDEALNIGVISVISQYSTNYSSGAGTENRNNNIDLVSKLLNNSVCEANGGTWSFNNVAGECSAEQGFLEAGAIVGNIYTKSIGGGVCQVATTVFNTVYESGFEIVSRHPHDLHMSSYPAGRDAAISYPDLDLIWRNNENSDVLVKTYSTGYSVECLMIGVDPKYTVKTEVSEWTPGDHYTSQNVIDPSKEPNSKFTQTSGSDGKSIVVKRLVYSQNGQLVRQDKFVSNYKPKTEIIVYGPGNEADSLLAAKNARMKTEMDNW